MADSGLNGDGPPSKRAKVQDPSNDFDQKSTSFEGFSGVSELPELPDELIGGGGDAGAPSLGVVGPSTGGPNGGAGAGGGGAPTGAAGGGGVVGGATAAQGVTSVVGVTGVSSITLPQAGTQMQQMPPNQMLQKQMVTHGSAPGGKTVLIQQGVQGGPQVFGVSQGDPNNSHSNNAMNRMPNAAPQIRAVRMGSPQHHMNMGGMNAGPAQMNQAQLQNALQNKQGLPMNTMSSQPNIVQGNTLVRLPTSDANAMGGLRPNTTMMNGPQGGHLGGISGPGVVPMGMNARGIPPMNINARMMNGHPNMSMNNPNCPTMQRVPVSGTLVQNPQGMMVMNTTNVTGPGGGQMIMQGQFRPNGPMIYNNFNPMQTQQMGSMGPNQVLINRQPMIQTQQGMPNMQPGQIGGPMGQQIIQPNQQVMNPAGGNLLPSVPPMSGAGNQTAQPGQPGKFGYSFISHW